MTGIINAVAGREVEWRRSTWSPGNAVIRAAAEFNVSGVPNAFAFGRSGDNTSLTYAYISLSENTVTTASLPALALYYAAAASNNEILAFRNAAATVYRSTNGTTWTAITTPNSTTYRDAIFDGTRFLATTSNATNRLIHSTDGTSWTSVNNLVNGIVIGYDGNSSYICPPPSSGGTIYSHCLNADPTVAANWTTGTLPLITSRVWSSMVFGNGIWVAAAASSATYATSTNGTTWTTRTLPSLLSDGTSTFAKMVFVNDAFYYYYFNNIYKSVDGINWTTDVALTTTTPNLINLMAWAGSGQIMYGFGTEELTSTNVAPYIRLG
jgi:hypothetical protein